MTQKKPKSYLWTIRQDSGKTLHEYLSRFTNESHKIEGFDDKDAITTITGGARTSNFLKSIVGRSRGIWPS